MQLRYPNITGKTPEERQRQTESYLRTLVDQLNIVNKKSVETKPEDSTLGQTANYGKKISELGKSIETLKTNLGKMQEDVKQVATLAESFSEPNAYYEYNWSACMVRVTRFGKIRFVNIYVDTKIEAASTLGTLLEIDCPAYDIKGAEWVPNSSNSAFASRVITIKTDGKVSTDSDIWRGGYSIMYVVP